MKIGIIIIATGRYINFFDKLYTSIIDKFLDGHEKRVYLFTDSTTRKYPDNVHVVPVERRGFPHDTLFRYNHFLKINDQVITETDAVYYMDVDSLIVNVVGDEILPSVDKPLIAVAHPGFYKISLGTPETRPISKAYIAKDEKRECYVAGGFQGGCSREFMMASKIVNEMIFDDYNRNVVPVWNDESSWNRYYTSNVSKFKILTPSYVYPECKYKNPGLGNYHTLITEKIVPRILALDKDHAWYRTI
jgi:hypothetical protein